VKALLSRKNSYGFSNIVFVAAELWLVCAGLLLLLGFALVVLIVKLGNAPNNR